LGTLNYGNLYSPYKIKTKKKWISVSAGLSHSLAISKENELYAWGDNRKGQLGDSTTEERHEPTNINTQFTESKLIKVSAGFKHSIILDEEGSVYACGSNRFGQLALNRSQEYSTNFIKIYFHDLIGSKIIDISGGRRHSLALDDEGNVYSWGFNGVGSLGNESDSQSSTETFLVSSLKTKIEKISSSNDYSVVLDVKGNLYGWGYNEYGQFSNKLGIERIPIKIPNINNVTQIATGPRFLLALTMDGNLYGRGDNKFGELGDGSLKSSTDSFTRVKTDSLGIDKKNINQISVGSSFSILLLKEENKYYDYLKMEGGYAVGEKIAARKNRPEAVVCLNDEMAIGVIQALIAKKVKVPEEISVVGIDNIKMANFYNPSLTTVNIPVSQMGKKAAEILLKKIAGRTLSPKEKFFIFPTELIIRDSSRKA
jgi:alpha-tubulin suppressor-like RCC1 family protein